jgi:ketosteroid isomerase-like protein
VYHHLVRRNVRRAYRALSQGDHESVTRAFAPTAELWFVGDHALGGRLEGRELIREWFRRLFAIFPDLRLEPEVILVDGLPWNTVAATRFRVTATLPNGKPYTNSGMQFLRLRWGRIVEDRLYEDTHALSRALNEIAAGGTRAASAAPLADPVP